MRPLHFYPENSTGGQVTEKNGTFQLRRDVACHRFFLIKGGSFTVSFPIQTLIISRTCRVTQNLQQVPQSTCDLHTVIHSQSLWLLLKIKEEGK